MRCRRTVTKQKDLLLEEQDKWYSKDKTKWIIFLKNLITKNNWNNEKTTEKSRQKVYN